MFSFASPSIAQPSPPAWANQIIEDIRSMEMSTTKIEKTVGSIDTKETEMDQKINRLDNKITEVESSCSFLRKEYDKPRQELNNARTESKNLQTLCRDLDQMMNNMQAEKETYLEKIRELDFRSMRESLIFYELPEKKQQKPCK